MRASQGFSELYSAYAAGSLDPAFALLVEAQKALRRDVTDDVAASEVIAGALLEDERPAPVSDAAIDRALKAIEAMTPLPRVHRRAASEASDRLGEMLDLPEPVRAHAIDAVGRAGWGAMGKGIKRLKLDCASQLDVELFRIDPNAAVPRHSHGGNEYTLVLAGGFSDENGSYGPGDLIVKGPEHTHRPVGDEDGVCYVLAVRDGGLKFKGAMGFVQRLIGQ